MGTLSGGFILTVLCGILQVLATQNDHEPMVAFICNMPAMHRGVNGWISDKDTKECWDNKRDILNYCRKMYPNHNITNVVEASYLVTIPGWPSKNGDALHDHRVRPFRCIVDSFQSDALLVPQHCKFDHDHDDQVCKDFKHWEGVARNACTKDGMHCESFGMLLNCGLGTFSGVEYVCCPNKTPTLVHPTPTPKPQPKGAEVESDQDDSDDSDGWESKESEDVDQDTSKVNLYELYLKGEPMPSRLVNEHQRFEAARQYMHKLQEAKNTQLMKEWTAARDHVNEVRKNDPKTANKLSEEIAQRFQRLYSAYEQEDIAEKQQIVALHQQRVQSDLNQRKRVAMDKYMRSLEKGDVMRINRNLRNYIKAEEKDVMHTVNHYGHVKATNSEEATRIHDHVIQHLKLCQQRMEQALEMLQRYPEIERQVRPQIEEFMKKFDNLAVRIRNVVLPDPSTSNIQSDSEDNDSNSDQQALDSGAALQPQKIDDLNEDEDDEVEDEVDEDSNSNESAADEDEDEDVREDEHDYERNMFRPAHQQHSAIEAQQDLKGVSAGSSAQMGTTIGIAIGSVAIFVVLVVAVVMMRRRSASAGNVTHGYVEVDPAASPEERHVANMQMNGYENPTYRYFEVQTAK